MIAEEKNGISNSISELRSANPELSKFFDGQKENNQGKKDRQELLRIFNGARNKFTMERAIRAVYNYPSKDLSLEEILV